ncbi:MAG TPA: D-alanine--D-alanine ligase, partial [Gemmataceae bacterium]|nr:D-alanine--D-alanine ligase [Gemmataceae bacterium]
VEEFIAGDELTVGVIGNAPPRLVGIMRVLPCTPTAQFVYSLEVKRDYLRQVRYESPPDLPATTIRGIEEAAFRVFAALGCRDVARVDFRLRDGIPYFLEINPLPGLNPESSDLVILARLVGWSYPQLIGSILQAAIDRQTV